MSERELFVRHPANPILTAEDWPYPVNAVFNPAAAVVDGETVLLARVEDLRGISHLTVARSANGIDGWRVADGAAARARGRASRASSGASRTLAAVWVEELDRFVITCTAYGPGRTGRLSRDDDGLLVGRAPRDRGQPRRQERRDPARAGRREVDPLPPAHHRLRPHPGISLSRSADLVSWSPPEAVLQPRQGAWWDSLRIGIGPPLLKTEHGWLLVYHGVKETVAGAHLPARARAPRSRRADSGAQPRSQLDPRAARDLRADRRRAQRALPLRPRPRAGLGRATALLRRRRHVDLPRDGAARRSARGRARRSA